MYMSNSISLVNLNTFNSVRTASIVGGNIPSIEPHIDPNIYIYFATCFQLFNKKNRKEFVENINLINSPMFKMLVPDMTTIKLESISLTDPNNTENDKIWRGPNLYSDISNNSAGFSIDSEIKEQLRIFAETGAEEEYRQIRIKVNVDIPEFIFMEFTIKGDKIEYSNKLPSRGNSLYLEYFPLNTRVLDYQLCLIFMTIYLYNLTSEKVFLVKPVYSGNKIINSLIKFKQCPSFIFENTPNLGVFKFTDFDLLLNCNQQFESYRKDSFYYLKLQALLFKSTKIIDGYNFILICENIREVSEKYINEIKISKDCIFNKTSVLNVTYSLVEIENLEKKMKVILRRPKSVNNDRMRDTKGLSIEYTSFNTHLTTITRIIHGEETFDEEVITTSFFLKHSWKNEELLNIFKNKYGLVSITINGQRGIIGTYGICFLNHYCITIIYSDKLESIPFPR